MSIEPYWWQRARDLRARGYSLARVGRIVRRDPTSVKYAVEADFRERKRASFESRPRMRPHNEEELIRHRILNAAHAEAEATGKHVDDVLAEWREPRRREISL